MDPAKVGDQIVGPAKPEDLKINYQTFYYILHHTMCPLVSAHSQREISGILCNTLYAISCGYVFDVEDLFIRILVHAANEHLAPKVFAPWIQKMINLCLRKEYLAKEVPEKFIPPVRDTLQVMKDMSKGKAIVDSSSKIAKQFPRPQIPERKMVSKPSVPSHLEISLHTQQLLEKQIHQDQKEKEHLACDLNDIQTIRDLFI